MLFERSRRWVFAVTLALFVLAPIAEAAACGGEVVEAPVAANYEISLQDSRPSDKLPADPDTACVHGHCHHNSQPLAYGRDHGYFDIAYGSLLFDRAEESRPDALLDILYPPPRT